MDVAHCAVLARARAGHASSEHRQQRGSVLTNQWVAVHNGHSGRPRAQSHSVCQRRIMQRAYINTPVRAPTLVRRAEPNSICLPAASAARSLDRSPGAAHRFLIHMPPA